MHFSNSTCSHFGPTAKCLSDTAAEKSKAPLNLTNTPHLCMCLDENSSTSFIRVCSKRNKLSHFRLRRLHRSAGDSSLRKHASTRFGSSNRLSSHPHHD